MAKDKEVEIARLQSKYAYNSAITIAFYQAIVSAMLVLAVFLLDHPVTSFVISMFALAITTVGVIGILVVLYRTRKMAADMDEDFDSIPT